MNALQRLWPIDVFLFASPVYWSDENKRKDCAQRISQSLETAAGAFREGILFHFIDSPEKAKEAAALTEGERATLFVPMSGAVQPWMLQVAAQRPHLALLNAYLPGILSPSDAHAVMHRNAHPACTDFHASCRLRGIESVWLDTLEGFFAYLAGWQGSQRLRHATFLKIGETEPWVINSCRDPQRFQDKWGTKVIPLDRDAVYQKINDIDEDRTNELAQDWVKRAGTLIEIVPADVEKACQVVAAMEALLSAHEADALSMACFAMIGDIDTTSCLALSTLNDSATAIGACEGDLDAAATLFLLRALGADFVWIGNPILHPGSMLELAHCTAPRCACGELLPYKLMRHHESGRGVAPEVTLPAEREVTLARIGDNLSKLSTHLGTTHRIDKMPTCHTQIQVDVGDTRNVVDHLLGTHLIMSYGNWEPALRYAARFLELDVWTQDKK